jgi:hypothetical protein
MDSNLDNINEIIMQVMCKEYEEGNILMNQYLNAKTLRHQISPVGWYTYFQVDNSCPRLLITSRCIDNAKSSLTVRNMKHGIGFILWIENGLLSCLETYTYDGDLPRFIEIISVTYGSKLFTCDGTCLTDVRNLEDNI